MYKSTKIIIRLSFLNAIGILFYWIAVFTGLFEQIDLVPGYINWFMSFVVVDLWIALSSSLTGYFHIKSDKKAGLFGIITGASLIFLGLYALMYGILTGLLFILTIAEIVEIAIKIYTLSVGPLFIIYHWKYINNIEKKIN